MFILATMEDIYDEYFDLDAVRKFNTREEARDYLEKNYNEIERKNIKIWSIGE